MTPLDQPTDALAEAVERLTAVIIRRGSPKDLCYLDSLVAALSTAQGRIGELAHENDCLQRRVAQVDYPCSPHCDGYLREMKVRREAESALATYKAEIGQALLDVAAERRRQIEVEGWSLEHDDGHGQGEIADAASAWASTGQQPVIWSWAHDKAKHPRRRQLVIAGALIVAEIERLDRAALASPGEGDGR